MRRRTVMAGVAALALGLVQGPAAAGNPSCAVPPVLLETAASLPHLGVAIERSLPVKIIALGAGTTQGLGASSPMASYPMRLEAILKPRTGGAVTMINLGKQGQSTSEMLARLERDVLAQKPTLVLWETGTVDAVRGVPLDEFTVHLEAGIAKLRQAGIDVLLVDPQYARHTARVVNILPFVEAMRTMAGMGQLVLFDRFEVMRHWIDNNVFQLDERAAPRLAAGDIDKVYNCIAELLAEQMLAAAPKASHTAAK
jgi:lysophospholipase L1-like esterase